jgi:NAD(P)-dependent dehydrogenase (short-subunit alcohol dehydrogenase family)
MNLLITGATGIAEATARLATGAGHQVFVASKDEAECTALAEALDCWALPGDLTDPAFADEAVQTCAQTFGRIDGVFHVAGGSGRKFGDGPLHEITDAGWEKTLALNLDATFYILRAAVKAMQAQSGSGSVVLTGSVLATHPEPSHFATHAYAAAKGALNALVTTTAAHYAKEKIRINAVAPGLVRTPMSLRAQSDPKILELMKTKQPLSEDLLAPEAIAHAALFLLGPESAQITGQILTVDGGWSVS